MHFVIASRRTIRGITGDLIGEDELRFVDHELAELAHRAGAEPSAWTALGGWPTLVVLAAARFDVRDTNEFAWNTVLSELSEQGRLVLAALVAIGGGDTELLQTAMADADIDPDRILAGIPLVTRRPDGCWVPHDLWTRITGFVLDRDTVDATRRRAARLLLERGEHDQAFHLFADTGDWTGAADVPPRRLPCGVRRSSPQHPGGLAGPMAAGTARRRGRPVAAGSGPAGR